MVGVGLFSVIYTVLLIAQAQSQQELSITEQEQRCARASFTDHLSSEHISKLSSGEEVAAVDFGANVLSLAPPCILPRAEAVVANSKDNVLVEVMFLISLTADQLERLTPLELYNIPRAASTLEGLKYYSSSEDKYIPVYAKSYSIDSPITKNKQSDPLVSTIPDFDVQYMRQEDRIFGENTYRAHYEHSNGITSVLATNVNTLWYFIFPVLQKEKMHIFFSMLPTEAGILFYTMSLVEAKNLFGLENQLANGFKDRLKAVASWLKGQLVNITE